MLSQMLQSCAIGAHQARDALALLRPMGLPFFFGFTAFD
jgi:hypothetical protein